MRVQIPPRREFYWVSLLSLLGAFRVFVCCAGFPVFTNVDEPLHFDLVVKYSHGEIPRGLEKFSMESARALALYQTLEYAIPPERLIGRDFPSPRWRQPLGELTAVLAQDAALSAAQPNIESLTPPLYYVVAGLWRHLGIALGLGQLASIYWIRFMNVGLIVLLVWLGFAAARIVFPNRSDLHFGVPLLLAVFPQDSYYYIQSDVLSPLCFGAAFVCCVLFWRQPIPDKKFAVAGGLALAATGLTKIGNFPLLVVTGLFALVKMCQLFRQGRGRENVASFAVFICCAVAPIFAWLIWCQSVAGDLTGSREKIEYLGWTRKAFSSWWPHPIFTLEGFYTFASELLASFWRGEIRWHGKIVSLPLMDGFYWASSLLLCAIAVGSLFTNSTISRDQRGALLFGFLSFTAAGAFLAWLSIVFDFGECFYPSRAYPYFVSGRLMTGALIPFILLYMHGLDQVLLFLKKEALFLRVVIAIAVIVMASEIHLNTAIFQSEYSWFRG